MALLELKGITAGYGQNVILRDFNLNVERGEFVSLLGSSGCGKTTTLRLIAGFSEPMQGTISFVQPQMEQIAVSVIDTDEVDVKCVILFRGDLFAAWEEQVA